ncbi:hypothetical protein WR25_15331 isoform A [Diploscapter pachys]|uniref:Sugar phosphate transporter domain-containing protein n=2 Tax=Diploscapter pachys TaxID=2018661 RepID=A0A2A2KL08_9BILA|nr:hypothetical protein WR25_15331 isoform A [Diploscapter pachys]
MIGLCAALLSTFIYSFLNILVKKLLKESDMHPIRLLAKNSQIASLIFFPIWLIHDAWNIISDVVYDSSFAESATGTAAPDLWMICLLAASGFLSFLQNLCSFTLINELTALSYAVCNAAKRITVIGASLLTLHNPVTGTNVFGMMLAIAGVFCYNRAKQYDREELHTLPLSRTHTSLSDATLVAYDPQKLHDSDILYRAVNGRTTHEGSRLGEFSDEYANSYNQHRMDDISKEKSGRSRNVRFA